MARRPPQPAALGEAALHVLLALADGPRHGYAIMQTVAAESGGGVRLGPTTLYRTLRTLHEAGLVAEVPHDDPGDDARRRYYDITDDGRAAAREQLRRLQRLIDTARAKPRLHPDPA
ncbi:PadR family transcriptional regulator [Dactylosporangium sp. McL0621]|uniref:PadR family transcriptional regulator n=1 Tax=Dactylosporangium sp. McL0621 TaxID=3415678 RepID=UPI003CE77780